MPRLARMLPALGLCGMMLLRAGSGAAQPAAPTPATLPPAAPPTLPDQHATPSAAPTPPPQATPAAAPLQPVAPSVSGKGDGKGDGHGHGHGNGKDTGDDDIIGVSPQAQSFDGDPWGDDTSRLAAGPLTFRLALQTRYRETFAERSHNPRQGFALREDVLAADGDGFQLQRFLLRMEVAPKTWLRFKGTLDFAKLRGSNVSNVVKQAIASLRPLPGRLELYAGVFKLPYSILELDPVARYELTEFGDANQLINDLGFAGRDVGVAVTFAPLARPKWLRVVVGTFRGHAKDEHASPLGVIAGRIESKPWFKGLRLGVSIVGMPFAQDYKQPFETSGKDVLPDPPDPLYPREQRWASGKAYGADISYTRERFSVRVEGLLGDRIDVDQRYGARSFSALWALLAYRFKLGKLGLMPAARVELMDADREHDTGRRLQLSFGVNVLYKKYVRFVIDLAHTDVQAGSPVIEQPRPLPYYPYLALDNTQLTGQLQLEL